MIRWCGLGSGWYLSCGGGVGACSGCGEEGDEHKSVADGGGMAKHTQQ